MRYFAYDVAFAVAVLCSVAWLCRRAAVPWWLTGIIAITTVAALWKFLGMQIGVKGRSRYDLEKFIKSLVVAWENGASLDVRHRGSGLRIRITRASGGESSAEVVLAIPRASWSEVRAAALARTFEQQGISFAGDGGSLTATTSLMEARVAIPYIWTRSVGAKPARVAHLILDTFDVGPSELLDVRFEGVVSDRLKKHREEFVNL